jgi:hypothetical protein
MFPARLMNLSSEHHAINLSSRSLNTRRCFEAFLLACILGASFPVAADPLPTPADQPLSLWISPGFWSHHFDRSAGYREDNVGLGAEVDISSDWFAQAGSYINSDRARTRYFGGAWEPLERWGIRVGLYGGAFDGYPAMHSGGWFVAAFPVISYRTDRLGVNLTVIPSYQNRLHGAIVAQALLRVW